MLCEIDNFHILMKTCYFQDQLLVFVICINQLLYVTILQSWLTRMMYYYVRYYRLGKKNHCTKGIRCCDLYGIHIVDAIKN